MIPKETDLFMNRFSQALSRSIQSKCAELTVLFDRASISELQAIYPILIDNIFGPQGSFSWGLRNTSCELSSQDSKALKHFFSPLGPLFKAIYMLLRDPMIKYEFSVAYLPTKIRLMLESTNIHPFYCDLIHVNPQSRKIVSLFLNPFDYYIFHFAYHLINPWQQRAGVSSNSWNTVYFSLCCDYIVHFLPVKPNTCVLPIIEFYCGKNPIQPLPSFNRPAQASQLLRSAAFDGNSNEYRMHQTLDRHPRNEIWRTETILVVFTDMWLNNDQVNASNHSFNGSPAVRMMQFNELPTGEYIRIVRVFIKQLHTFAASAKVDDTHMGELKKITTSVVQGKMYIFLRNLIHRWPLDGSFRLVLELWLSFIQPWRYAATSYVNEINHKDNNPDLEDLGTSPQKSVDAEYMQFIAENLLAYIVIFQQLLPRFIRIDLASPKMSLMLYRLTKVFDQPNLVPFLREIEACLSPFNHSPTHSFHSQVNTSLPPLSPTSIWSTNTSYTQDTSHSQSSNLFDTTTKLSSKWGTIARQKIYELEGPNFCYKPLFTKPLANEIYELMEQIKAAKTVAKRIIKMRKEEEANERKGFIGFFKGFLLMDGGSTDEFTLMERQKVVLYLDCCLQNLMDIFQINEVSGYHNSNTSAQTEPSTFSIEDNLSFLTPQKVRQRINQIKYEGDPELLPVGSHENKFLVDALYRLSSKINEQFQHDINRFYYRGGYLGRLARNVLQPPITIYRYDKTQEGRSPRVPSHLPPRVSLRPLASHKFLTYMLIGALVSKLFGYSTSVFFLVVFVMWALFICLKSIKSDRQVIDSSMNVDQ